MIDGLIILNGSDKAKKGFFKFENCFRDMTVGVDLPSDNYLWCIADEQFYYGTLNGQAHTKTQCPVKKIPTRCGIFKVESNIAIPVAFSQDEKTILERAEKELGLKINSQSASEMNDNTVKNEPVQSSILTQSSKELEGSKEDFGNREDGLNWTENKKSTDTKSASVQMTKAADTKSTSVKMTDETVQGSEKSDEDGKISAEKSGEWLLDAYKNADYTLPKEFLSYNGSPETYWECNEKELVQLLENNPEEKYMSDLIPGSKWVKIAQDDAKYILGVIYDEDSKPMYICYGFELGWSEEPPEKLEGYCQWIPKDCAKPHDEGYWVVYVNAKTGERVR